MWTPRSRWSLSASAVAAGIAPIPSWSVAPSGTSSATTRRSGARRRRSSAPVVVRRLVDLDREVDVADVDEAVAEGPRHGAVELGDDRASRPPMAACIASTETPSEQKPLASGGVTLTGRRRAAPRRREQASDVGQEGRHVVRRPSAWPAAAFGPTNSARCREVRRHRPAPDAVPDPRVWRWTTPTSRRSGGLDASIDDGRRRHASPASDRRAATSIWSPRRRWTRSASCRADRPCVRTVLRLGAGRGGGSSAM